MALDKQFFVELGLITKDLINELNKSKKNLKEFGAEVKQTFETAGGSWKQLTDGTVLFKAKGSDAFITVSRHVKTFKERLGEVGSFLERYSTQFIALGGMITGALTATIYKAAEAGDRIDDLSKATGIAATELSRLGYAAEQNGSSLDQMANGLKVLYARMGDAKSGLKEAQDAFKQLGISWQNLDGSLKSGSEIIPEIAEKISLMRNETEQSALASELFGRRAGPDLLPMLQLGAKGIQEMADEADRLGITMDSVQAKTLGDFNDALTALKGSLAGLLRTAVIPLVEHLKPFVERLTETAGAIRKWSEEHKTLSSWLMKLVGGGGLLLIFVGTIAKLIPILTQVGSLLGKIGASAGIAASSLGLIAAGTVVLYAAYGKLYSKVDSVNQKTREFIDTLSQLDSMTLDQIQEEIDGIVKQIEILKGIQENAGTLDRMFAKIGAAGGPVGSLLAWFTKERMLGSTEKDIADLENILEQLRKVGEEKKKAGNIPGPVITESSFNDQMNYLKTLLDFGKLTSKQYVQVLEQMLLNEKFTAEEKKNIEQEILATRLSLYQEAVKGQEQASKQMTDIEKKRKDLTIQGLKDTKKAYDDYRQSIINYANQLRSQFKKTLEIGVISSTRDAETFINSVLQELANKRSAVIEGNVEEIKEIERSGAEERLNIQKELSDQLISTEEETQDKIASLRDKKLSIEKSSRGKMMEQLSKYVEFDKLVAMSFEDLATTYERYKKDIIAGTPGKVGVDTLQAQLAREKYERSQALGVSDITEQVDEYRALAEEEIQLEEEKQRRIKEIKDKYQADTDTSVEAERKRIQELSQTMITEIDASTTAIQEELQGLSQSWLKAQTELANNLKNQNKTLTTEYSQALTDYQKFSSDLSATTKTTFEAMPNLTDIFPPDVAANINSMGKETADLSTTFDNYLPRMIQSTSDFSSLVQGHMAKLKDSIHNSTSAVNQLAEAINNLKSKEITIKVNFAGTGISGLGMGANKEAVQGLNNADQFQLLRALDLASLQGTL